MKRLIAILLSALLLLPLGLVMHTDGASADTVDDLWAQITEYEDSRLSAMGIMPSQATGSDFGSLSDGIAAIVKSWSGYVPGSLVKNGDHLFWDGTDGMGYGYSPRMREKMRSGAIAEIGAEGTIETYSYARGGSPANNNVALIGPFYGHDSSFTDQYRNEAQDIAQTLGGTCTIYSSSQATIDNIASSVQSAGIVLVDSHGDTDYASGSDYTSRANTSYICLTSSTGLTSQDTATVQGPYGSYKHAYSSYGYAYVDGTRTVWSGWRSASAWRPTVSTRRCAARASRSSTVTRSPFPSPATINMKIISTTR